MSETNNTFKIGLCMAGAISAGAYTVGAIDYLFEALEEWQKRKDNNEPNTPRHNVEIPIIGGASAGGMTGFVLASAIQDTIHPVKYLAGNIMDPQPNNKFYHSWVDLVHNDMLSVLLNTDDINRETGVQSALNADFIDKVANRATEVSEIPAVDRKYISKNLKLFVTLSNLEGMDFSVAFRSNSDKNKYVVSSHNDYACFKLCESENNYSGDGWIPLNFKTKLNVEVAKNAAMATGAFPVGLKARKVSRRMQYMNDLQWFKYITRDAKNPFTVDPYNTVNVDGGMINNEPFDKIRELLVQTIAPQKIQDVQDHDKFESTVLMIDPFPSESGTFDDSTKMTTILGNTLGALISQSRLKSSVLIDALDSNKAGQFLIAPVRYEKKEGDKGETRIEGKAAIACGSLSGFGGFISKEFRIHDYFLGRSNCEKFLRDHFTVPPDTTNQIFVNGYSGTDKTKFTSKTDGGVQIIPIFTKMQEEPYMPIFFNGKQYPSVHHNDIKSYRKMLKARVEKIILNISDYSLTERVLLWIGAKVVLNGKIADAVIDTAIASLKEYQLIKD